jgi:hypothetical protein
MKKLLSLLILTGTLFAQANNVFTLNPSVSSAGMGNVGIAHADVKNVFHNPAFAGLKESHQEISYVDWLPNLTDDMGYQSILYTSDLGWSSEIFYFNYGNQIEADQGGIIIGDFESSSYRVSGGYGFGIGDWLFGARLNLYNHNFIDSFDVDMNYGFDLGAYKEFDVDYITLGGSIDAGIVDLSLAYYYNTDSFHNETLMISFGFDL